MDEKSVSSDARFRLLVDSIEDYAIFFLDTSGRISSWNKGAERLKGYTAKEALGMSFAAFYPPEDVASGKHKRLLAKALEDGHVLDEGWRVRKDGTRFWASVNITAIRDEQGRHIGYAKVTRDLTDRKKVEQELAESEERLRLMISHVVDYAIFMLDLDGRIISWNAGAERIKGYTAAEVMGRVADMFYPEEEKDRFRALLRKAKEKGSVEDMGWRVRKDGTKFWADVVISLISDDWGKPIGFAKITRDLTERRETELQIRRLNETLSARNADLAAFASTVSHDLKAPLRAMITFAQLLERSGLTAAQLAHAKRIAESGDKMRTLIDGLLEFTRLTEDLPVHPLELDRAVSAALAVLDVEIKERNASIAIKPSGLMVRVHAATFERMLLNLVHNALKFAKPGQAPWVEISARREGEGRVRVMVRDHGRGVAKDAEEKLFKPFSRLSEDPTIPGHGLGLSIVKRAASKMGAAVGYERPKGEGAVFWLDLAEFVPT